MSVRLLSSLLLTVALLSACGGESDPGPTGPGDTPDSITVTTSTVPDGDLTLPYSVTFAASGGSGAYTWRLRAGELPQGVTLDASTGTISGTPTRIQDVTFTLEASDASGSTPGTRAFSMTVHSAPSITSPAPPGGIVDTAYTHALSADGGRGAYEWSIPTGSLPPGLSLDPAGSIDGTPTGVGSWAFTLRLTSGPATVDQDLSIAVCATGSGGDPWAGIDPWVAYQRDAGHSGYVPVTLDVCHFAFAWESDLGAGNLFASQIVTGAGMAVATTYNSTSYRTGAVVGVDLSTGVESWRVGLESPGHPGLVDGVVYVNSGRHADAELVAIDAASGSQSYQTSYQDQLSRYRSPVVAGGRIVSGATSFGGVQVYDQMSGDSLWAQGGSTAWDWGPTADDSTVYMLGGSLYRYDIDTGALLGTTGVGCTCSGAGTTMISSAGYVVAAANDVVTAMDVAGDSIAWSRSGYGTSLASANGRLYTIFGDALEVVDESTGSVVKTWQPPHDAVGGSTLLLVTDNLLFLVFGGQVHAVDLGSWDEVWHYPLEGAISLSDGMLFIHTTDGVVVAISADG